MTTSEWIEWKWTEERPYPETLETRVHVKFRCGDTDEYFKAQTVSQWGWEKKEGNPITHYRLA